MARQPNTISFNIHAQGNGVQDPGKMVQWHADNNPNWSLVMDNLGYAIQLKNASPVTNVIHRWYTPDGAWFNHTPREYVEWVRARRREMGDPDIWCYCENEAGFRPDWFSEVIKINNEPQFGNKIVFLNASVGTPQDPKEWLKPDMRQMLTLAAQNRDKIALALHEYGHVTLTSGYAGQHFWTYIPDAPKVFNPSLPAYHVGRYKYLEDYYPNLPFRIVITEHGWDTLGDMTWWFEKSGGWEVAAEAWKVIYGAKVDIVQTALQQLEYANNVIYRYGSKVEGQLLYTYGHVGDRWVHYDTERLGSDFLTGVAKINRTGLSVPVPPVVVPPPVQPPPPVIVPKTDDLRVKEILAQLQLIIDKYK